jgi:hypothetical protein
MTTHNNQNTQFENYFLGLSIPLGLLLGAVLGVVFWILTSQFILFIILLGCGLSGGIAIGSSLDQWDRKNVEKEKMHCR